MASRGPLSALEKMAITLRERQRAFALVGGLAVTVRSEPRFTRDVDLCVVVDSDDEAEQLMFQLRGDGYSVSATVEHGDTRRLSTARLRGPDGIVCDLLLASSGIEEEVVARATFIDVTDGLCLPVARVEELLALKVLSATSLRLQDESDIRNLIAYNPTFSREDVEDDLRLIEQRGYQRGQDLSEKWRQLQRRISV